MTGSWFLPVWAMAARDLRKFFRSPALLLVSLVLPLAQLVILGNAFGGQIKGLGVALVDLDRGVEAIRLREKFRAVEANADTFHIQLESTLDDAVRLTRDGTVVAAIVIPEHYSRRIAQRQRPSLGLVLDNTDLFVSATLSQKLSELVAAVNQPEVSARYAAAVALDIVELYPYIEYVQYLLPAMIALAVFVQALLGGGLMFIDDKARGFHEGYLVTPISKSQLVFGLLLSGTVKATLAGIIVTVAGAIVVGMPMRLTLTGLLLLLLLLVTFAFALLTFVSMLMARVSNPLIPRATFGMLITLLFFPSGALYPVTSFPPWLQTLARVDPFTYAVHGLRAVVLKDVAPSALLPDIGYLAAFSVVCTTVMLMLFPRRL